VVISPSAPVIAQKSSVPYIKKNTWQETMLTLRANLILQRKEQEKMLSQVRLSDWYSMGPLEAKDFSEALFPEKEVDITAKDANGEHLWRKHTEWKDGIVHKLSDKESASTYLYRTITVDNPVIYTTSLGSNDGIEVWLEGQKIFSNNASRLAAPDQDKVLLNLKQGENQLMLKIFNREDISGFYFSLQLTPDTEFWLPIERDFPVQWDWADQDAAGDLAGWFTDDTSADVEKKMIASVLEKLGSNAGDFRNEFDKLVAEKVSPNDSRWLDLYVKACERRRGKILRPFLEKYDKIVFTKHYNLGGSHYAYTEGLSDAQNERHFKPGTSLCILEMDGLYGRVNTLIEDSNGVIRDPDISWDGKRILFSWKKSDRQDDYHLYEMDAESGRIRQLTFGLGFADYESAYLPNGDIIFNSSRCIQTVDCWWTEVSNLYTCDRDGRYLRRLSFDQVHTNYPTVLADGRVIYTRWDYNDRGQLFPQGLFQMNSDGTSQAEFYGNNSWFPTTIAHARGIPGTQKILAVAIGHHTRQTGKLIIVDPARGRQENSGVQLIAPPRDTEAVRIDRYGQKGDLFQYPYPISETLYMVTYRRAEWKRGDVLSIYIMNIDGQRELLVTDDKISCNQPIPLARRPRPHLRPEIVDYRKKTGTYYVQDVYAGPGLEGIARGTVKKLRVIALDFRAAGVGNNGNRGPGGGALVSTPISIDNGSWDVKLVLGSAKVYEDGSAFFEVPARTPVYFQALDEKDRVVQSMRSWSTLQPGENFSCVGCHESKNGTPPAISGMTLANKAGAQPLEPFYGDVRGFSFIKEIQPILDRHCIRCHDGAKPDGSPGRKFAFSLLGKTSKEKSGRKWSESYLTLTNNGKPNKLVNWLNVQSVPPMLPPYYKGSAVSGLIGMLEKGHNDVKLSREDIDKIACWIDLLVPYCGDYTEANAWSQKDIEKYDHFLQKRKRMEQIELENIEALIAAKSTEAGAPADKNP
jgi:hypothetical protein